MVHAEILIVTTSLFASKVLNKSKTLLKISWIKSKFIIIHFKLKPIKLILLVLVLEALAYGIRYAWISFPIISGYGAKNMCSCLFVTGMDIQKAETEELGRYPLSLATYKVNYTDSSVTATVFGFAKQKAIYRQGFGCTLINDVAEKVLRAEILEFPARPAADRDTIAWPMGDKIINDSLPGIDVVKLKNILKNAINRRDAKGRQGTRSLLVVYDGKIVGEEYADGISKDTKLLGWSMAKSITAALVGILVKEGKLKIDEPAPIPELNNTSDKKNAILLKHLLQQTSGLDFEEDYTKSSDVTKMLFQKSNMAAYVLARPKLHEPGTVFNYSSGNSNILSYIIRKSIGEKDYHLFPYKSLIYPAGMYQTVLETDASGTFVGSSYVYATTRDYARFGLLYLNDGKINGQQILPEGWVKESRLSSTADKFKQYGYQFWLNGEDENNPGQKIYPSGPDDLYYADGVNGQRILIIPSKKMVIVRMGFVKENLDSLIKEVLECIYKK